jgi:2'-5' RNA ligase superfamily
MTIQGVGHTLDLPDKQLHRITSGVASRLVAAPAFTAMFGAPTLHSEAVVMHPADPEPFHRIRRTIRAGLADALGVEHVPKGDRFRLHVSSEYANGDTPAELVRQLLTVVAVPPVEVPVTFVSLIEIHRDQRMYQWRIIDRQPLGSPL